MLKNQPEYQIWCSIKQRCFPSKNKFSYEEGVPIERRWKYSYEDFLKDVGKKPKGKYYLVRKNKKKGYVKGNMAWQKNKPKPNIRYKYYLTYKNKTKPLCLWCKEYNIKYTTGIYRYKKQWTPQKILGIKEKLSSSKS